MHLRDIIPKDGPQRAYCAGCNNSMDLVFRRLRETVSGVAMDIDGLPMLWCEACNLTALPDRSRASIMRAHDTATEAGEPRFVSRRRKIERDFGFTAVPFAYDPDDYFYYPGLERPFDVGFLTPIFFNKRVLSKYDVAPDYAVRFASRTYGEIVADRFSIPFGINRHGAVVMWLGDISKLPTSEQYYLMSENRPSDHSLGSEFYEGQIECVFTPPSLEDRLFEARSAFHEACFNRFGMKLAHLDTEVLDIASSLVGPVLDSDRERRTIADALNKIHLESLDNGALERLIGTLRLKLKATGSLKRLQAVLESVDSTGVVNGLLSPFYTLYDFRVAYSHLGSGSGRADRVKNIMSRLSLPEDAEITRLYDAMVDGLTRSYQALSAIVKG
jgi:hypothetical protein